MSHPRTTNMESGGFRPHKRRAPTAPLQAVRSVVPSTNMQQATLLELLNHIAKLTAIVENMSTNIVVLNEKLHSNTKKVDRLLRRDVPATSLANGIDHNGRQGSGVPARPPTGPASATTEVVDMRDVAGQDTAGPTGSNSIMSITGVSPLSHNISPGSGRPSTPRHQRSASIVPHALKDDPPTDSISASHARDHSVFEGFDDSEPTAPHTKQLASAEALSNTKAPTKSKPKSEPSSKSAFAEALDNNKYRAIWGIKPEPTFAGTASSKHVPLTTQEAAREKKTRRPRTADDILEPSKGKTNKRGHAAAKMKGTAFNKEAPRKRQRMIDQLDSPGAK